MIRGKKPGCAATWFLLACIFIPAAGCEGPEKAVEVRLEKREALLPPGRLSPKTPVRIAVGSMITPKAGFGYYRSLLDYIGEKLGRPVQFVGKEKYAEVNELLRKGDLDVAFVCSGPYVEGHDRFGLELLAAPQSHGKTVYYSYIIVPWDSPARRLEDLRGKTFAFTDPDSNSGAIVPTYLLAQINETPGRFFKKYSFTYGHDKSIRAVAEGLVEGAAVDSLIWDYLAATEPESTARTRVLLKSSPYGIPPVVVHPGLDADSKKRLKKILLNINKDAAGREILKGMMVDRFVVIDDAAYRSVREIKNWIAEQSNPRGNRKP